MTAGQLLALPQGAVVSVVGCGGKTTFIQSLAQEFPEKKVLISPTTKIYPMEELGVNYQDTLEGALKHVPQIGVQCLGIANQNKLGALPESVLAKLVGYYALSLLEADGSRGLPCKGWLENEPVIPPYTTHTIGIVTELALGQPVSPETVLRIPQFTAITGLQLGEIITKEAFTKMVIAMFSKAVGKKYLFVNQTQVSSWLYQFKEEHGNEFAGIAYGSALGNTWNEV